jgi:U3 small nucleolar RNA-associated protein 13
VALQQRRFHKTSASILRVDTKFFVSKAPRHNKQPNPKTHTQPTSNQTTNQPKHTHTQQTIKQPKNTHTTNNQTTKKHTHNKQSNNQKTHTQQTINPPKTQTQQTINQTNNPNTHTHNDNDDDNNTTTTITPIIASHSQQNFGKKKFGVRFLYIYVSSFSLFLSLSLLGGLLSMLILFLNRGKGNYIWVTIITTKTLHTLPSCSLNC